MKPYARSRRVGGQIQKALSDILMKKVRDPRLEMATVTAVKMSSDLRSARVYYSISGDKENRDAAKEGFESARGYVKRFLAQQLGLRYMPEIKFYYDETFDYATHMNDVFKIIKDSDGSDNTKINEE